ncbi:MAG: TonB-dependent receptor [bacterium]|nr:TonB-dependent receptor [bacterium]
MSIAFGNDATFTPALSVAHAHVHGIVRDSADRKPLAGVTVRVLSTTAGAITDAKGVFHLHEVEGDSITLLVTSVGYRAARLRLALTEDVRIEVVLAPMDTESEGVLVEEDRIDALPSQNATVITSAELDEHRGQTFSDALTIVPGVTVMTTGPSMSKPVVRGMSGSRLVLRNNGLVQEGQQWGAEHAPEIDPFSPSRVTLIKGPAAVAYGPNAMGGVIDVEPRALPSAPLIHGEASLNLFSNNRQGAASVLLEAGGLFGEPLAFVARVSARRAGNATTPDYGLGNTGFSELSGSAIVGYGTGDNGITLNASRFATTLGIFTGSHLGNASDLLRAIERGRPTLEAPFTYAIGNPRQEIAHTMLAIDWHVNISDVGRLKLQYGWQQNDRSEFDAHNARIVGRGNDPVERRLDSITRLERSLQTPAMNLLLTTYSFDASLDHALEESMHGRAGVSALRQVNDRSGSVYLVPDYTAYGVGGYVYETMVVHDWTLSGGVRLDGRWLQADVRTRNSTTSVHQERTFFSASGAAGATWTANEHVELALNVGTAWRPPQVNELYANDVHHGVAYFEIGDSTLQPERNVGVDLSATLSMIGVQIDIGVYANLFDNYIYSLPDPEHPTITLRGTFPTYRMRQSRAFIGGADLSATVAINDVLNVYTKGSIVRGEELDRSVPLFLMPADRLRMGAHVHLLDVGPIHDAFVDVSAQGVARQTRFVSGEDYLEPPPSYATLDLDVGGSIDVLGSTTRLTLSVFNILDARYRDYLSRYRYFADDPGRNVVLRWHLPF